MVKTDNDERPSSEPYTCMCACSDLPVVQLWKLSRQLLLHSLVDNIQITRGDTISSPTNISERSIHHFASIQKPSSLHLNDEAIPQSAVIRLRSLLDKCGFRTALVHSPRQGLSIYKDSFLLEATSNVNTFLEKELLTALFGMHPKQRELETFYKKCLKDLFCTLLFCGRIHQYCPSRKITDESENDAMNQLAAFVKETKDLCYRLLLWNPVNDMPGIEQQLHEFVASFDCTIRRMKELVILASKLDVRHEQLENDLKKIYSENSTFSNALVQTIFLGRNNQYQIEDVYFIPSKVSKNERLTIYLNEKSCIKTNRTNTFSFIPDLHLLLTEGPENVSRSMINSFWSHLLSRGYYATPMFQERLDSELRSFFLSGICSNKSIPIPLNAQFIPSYPLSLYLHGPPGSGKSSFVSQVVPALSSVIQSHLDPALMIRFVKENLNKPIEVLKLEFDLRPNNNNMSIMSIIRSRTSKLGQSKPGLVVVGLEEMTSNQPDWNPNQSQVCELISQRFLGRKGDYRNTNEKAPRNSTVSSVGEDSNIISIYTSNYELQPSCCEALKKVDIFKNLCTMQMHALSGNDRYSFAVDFLKEQLLNAGHGLSFSSLDITLNIPLGEGDTRPLVRNLRMLSFYARSLLARQRMMSLKKVYLVITHTHGQYSVTTNGIPSLCLVKGTLSNLFPIASFHHDSRAQAIINTLQSSHELGQKIDNFHELGFIVDFWMAKVIAPVVIVSTDVNRIRNLMMAINSVKHIHCMFGVNASTYKMMKSLYDPNNTPNLRDDLMNVDNGALIAAELICETPSSQLCIREMIEDTPSMTAFSSEKSALYKEGILFAVYIQGEISEEIRSRASLLI